MLTQIQEGCRSAKIRCDECKFMAATSISAEIAPMQIRRRELQDKPQVVWEVLEDGARRASATANETMKTIRAATGLSRDLSGIRTEASLPQSFRTVDVRDLKHLSDWWSLEPAVLTKNLRTVWRQDVAGPHITLKADTEGVWLTRNNRRVYVAAAREQDGDEAWMFSVKPKSYEVLVLLCWNKQYRLQDFVIPQKMYVGAWTLAKRAAGKGDIVFSVALENEKYILNLPHSPGIDITECLGDYAVIGD